MDGSALCEAGKTISLDMTCFHWMGEYYVVWSQRQFLPKDLGAWLYIAKLNQERPWELASEPVLLSKPDYGWDNNHTFVDEGPFALVSGDKLFVTFSGAAVDESYVVSYLELINNDSLLDRNSWRKIIILFFLREALMANMEQDTMLTSLMRTELYGIHTMQDRALMDREVPE